MMAVLATRAVQWAICYARRAPTELHARRYIEIAGAEAMRAWRLARRVDELRRVGQ
jgi:hypothetical protein